MMQLKTRNFVGLTIVGAIIGFAACTKGPNSSSNNSSGLVLGSVDGKKVASTDLSETDKNTLYKNQKQFYDSTETLLAQHYFNQYLDDYRKKHKLASLEEAKQEFFAKNAKVEKEEVEKFLKDNESSPQLQQLPVDKRYDIIKNYLTQMAQSKATQEVIQKAKTSGKITVGMAKPNPPSFTFKTPGYAMYENADAPVTIVEFADFQCPYCVMANAEIKKVLAHYNKAQVKVQYVYYDFPLSFHDQATPASVAAFCASEQGKYWEMHNKIFDREARDAITSETFLAHAKSLELDLDVFKKCQGDKKSTEIVEAQMAEGMRIGVQGTPAIFINGVRFESQTNYASLKTAIDALL